MLFDPAQENLLAEILAWTQFARLNARALIYAKEIGEIETEKASLSKREKAVKTQMGKDLTRGGY